MPSVAHKNKIDSEEDAVKVTEGSVQGGICSPSIFNLYINHIVTELSDTCGENNVFAYADDIAFIVENSI